LLKDEFLLGLIRGYHSNAQGCVLDEAEDELLYHQALAGVHVGVCVELLLPKLYVDEDGVAVQVQRYLLELPLHRQQHTAWLPAGCWLGVSLTDALCVN
jgi:hypothetical protein